MPMPKPTTVRIKKPSATAAEAGKDWNRSSRSGKHLIAMMEDGTIQPTDKPKDIYNENHEIFGPYAFEKFEAAFYRERKKAGVCKRGGGKPGTLLRYLFVDGVRLSFAYILTHLPILYFLSTHSSKYKQEGSLAYGPDDGNNS